MNQPKIYIAYNTVTCVVEAKGTAEEVLTILYQHNMLRQVTIYELGPQHYIDIDIKPLEAVTGPFGEI